MRTRLPAALLLLLSWLLPAAGHAPLGAQAPQAVRAAQVSASAETARHAEQHSGARQQPSHPASAHTRATFAEAIAGGGPAVLTSGLPHPRTAWAAVVRRPATRVPPARARADTPARAPPSTAF